MNENVIYCGDNLEVLDKYFPDHSVDLVYIDPPFNSNRVYELFWGEGQERRQFRDRYGDTPGREAATRAYLDYMEPRIRQLYRVLKPTGSFYYHCDWHASHYIKEMLDGIFGMEYFQNEIIWQRQTAHSDTKQGAKHFGRLHDSLLLYTKSKTYTFNPMYQPYSEDYVNQFYKHIEPETGRRYQLSDLTGPGGASKGNPQYEFLGVTRYWRFTRERMQELYEQGRIVQIGPGTVPRQKRYLDEMPGVSLQSIWTDIPPVQTHSKERLGYPTQKPLALMERIVRASSNEGHLVLDAFCGCGTTLEAAAKLGRRWIGIDSSPTACRVMAERLTSRLGLVQGKDFQLIDMPKTADDLRRMPPAEFENWAVLALGGIPNRVKQNDFGIDGRVYVAERVKKPVRATAPLTKGVRRGEVYEAGTLFEETWNPIQVKQTDKVGRDIIDSFVGAMFRDRRVKGYVVAFGFTDGALREINRLGREQGMEIMPITVDELLAFERRITPARMPSA